MFYVVISVENKTNNISFWVGFYSHFEINKNTVGDQMFNLYNLSKKIFFPCRIRWIHEYIIMNSIDKWMLITLVLKMMISISLVFHFVYLSYLFIDRFRSLFKFALVFFSIHILATSSLTVYGNVNHLSVENCACIFSITFYQIY